METLPDDSEALRNKFNTNPNHKGLKAAYESQKNKRNPRVATVLVFGLTGSGKSSTVRNA
jgi:predicted GTPase